MSTTPPDRILDVRVRVPAGFAIACNEIVVTNPGGDMRLVPIEAIYDHPPREPKPSLQAGPSCPITPDVELDGPREIHDPEYVPSYAEATGRITDRQRLITLQDRINELEQRLDRLVPELTTKAVAEGIAERMTRLGHKADGAHIKVDALSKRVERLIVDKASGEVVGRLPRVIKGGWLNVYRDGAGYRLDDKPCSDKAAVDAFTPSGERIACIQIPDITEGEGL